jgi:hypothetical protein
LAPDVPLFRTEDRTVHYELPDGFHAVLIEVLNMADASTNRVVAPSPRRYSSGQMVTWEWGSASFDGPAFYADPSVDVVRLAWDGTADFQGRRFEEAIS